MNLQERNVSFIIFGGFVINGFVYKFIPEEIY